MRLSHPLAYIWTLFFILSQFRLNGTLKRSNKVCGAYQKGKRGKGFGALSKRFDVSKFLIETWYEKWVAGGRTPEAFEDEAGGDLEAY
jgi:hypothetical protein